MTEPTITQADRDAAEQFIDNFEWLCRDSWSELHPNDRTALAEVWAAHREAAVAVLQMKVNRLAKAVVELSDNVEDRDGLSNSTEISVDIARNTIENKL